MKRVSFCKRYRARFEIGCESWQHSRSPALLQEIFVEFNRHNPRKRHESDSITLVIILHFHLFHFVFRETLHI